MMIWPTMLAAMMIASAEKNSLQKSILVCPYPADLFEVTRFALDHRRQGGSHDKRNRQSGVCVGMRKDLQPQLGWQASE
jgi:hypothetical protein